MIVTVNGRPSQLATGASVADLLKRLGRDPRRPGAAVAVNGELVPRARWGARALVEGDRVEVLGAAQGG